MILVRVEVDRGRSILPTLVTSTAPLFAAITTAALVLLSPLSNVTAAPLLALIAIGSVAALIRPIACLCVLVAALAINWPSSPIPEGEALGQAHKYALVAVLAALLLRGPARSAWWPPLAALTLIAAFTLAFANVLAGVTPGQTFRSLVTLSIFWLALGVRWRGEQELRRILLLLAYTPTFSVLLGLILTPLGFSVLAGEGGTGAVRLSGATIAAYLGALGVVGIGAAVLAWRLWDSAPARRSIALNAAIVLMTGTRGAAAAAVIIAAPVAWTLLVRPSRGLGGVLARLGACYVFIVAVPLYASLLRERSTGVGDDFVNSSGRLEAWGYFVRLAEQEPLLGRGLGAGPLAAGGDSTRLGRYFVAQHNEYVRTFLEGGWLGTTLFWTAVVFVLLAIGRRVPRIARRDYVALASALLLYSSVDNTFSAYQFSVPFGLLLSCYAALAPPVSAHAKGENCGSYAFGTHKGGLP